jgi:hypothetical protein
MNRRVLLAVFVMLMMVIPAPFLIADVQNSEAAVHNTAPWSGKILHYELYISDGYINVYSGDGTQITNDPTTIAGWNSPVYIWGFSDVDPGGHYAEASGWLNTQTVPAGALAAAGGLVGNAKFPAPIIEANVGDDVYITVHNRGFYQDRQAVQDDHTLHLHGIHAESVYDGFPESAGSYAEYMNMFWRSAEYGGNATVYSGIEGTKELKNLTNLAPAWPNAAYPLNALATKLKDSWWNNMDAATQQKWLADYNSTIPSIRNALSVGGGVPSQFNPEVIHQVPSDNENVTQYTYYFRAVHSGTYMYHCHVVASEHVQMGMYGAMVIRPFDYIQKDMGHLLSVDANGRYADLNYNGVKDAAPAETYYDDRDGDMTVSLGDNRNETLIMSLGDMQFTYPALSYVNITKTVYGVGTNTEYDEEYVLLISEFDPVWHQIIERGKGAFYPPNWNPQLWFVNGRTFPETAFPFQFGYKEPNPDMPGQMWFKPEPRYNTYMATQQGHRVLERWINMGYQDHPMHQHGWHMEIVGSDAMQFMMNGQAYREVKFTLSINSGETYDTITNIDPVYDGENYTSGSPITTTNGTGGTNLKWRALYPIHDHDDYRVTTNGIYPGGALILLEAVVHDPQTPETWENPYNGGLPEPLPPMPPVPTSPYGY